MAVFPSRAAVTPTPALGAWRSKPPNAYGRLSFLSMFLERISL
jgi:hypothetical protein